ncbi:alpha/beta hydrolase [Chitinivorax sp. B]|uniref:RBBP9/YdeN family alpha/beta hydrolase n=1 Tax=Chitinivorax sp. B TaxID=2502235 RepID=UPI0010F87804|nr:alpha/beta hydrolase [Chitinivorax sp. B]
MSVDATVLILPGLFDSGPAHWQSRWQQRLPRVERVCQKNWSEPVLANWVAALAAHLAQIEGPVVLAAHSLGCITAVYYAQRGAQQVIGALLVAPADVERHSAPDVIKNFAPIPRARLPFPAIVVASDDDPYCEWQQSAVLADAWGAELVQLHGAGHINSESGLGDWEAGLELLTALGPRVEAIATVW